MCFILKKTCHSVWFYVESAVPLLVVFLLVCSLLCQGLLLRLRYGAIVGYPLTC